MRPVESHEACVGALVLWMHKPRGGYGYTIPVDARITALNQNGDRATIEVKTKVGARVSRTVKTSALQWKNRT